MSLITTKDGTQIHYKDWGTGKPVVFSHGWPLNADSWEAQMLFVASKGYRCIAHNHRGHGRSSQPGNGNERDNADRSLFYKDLAGCPFLGANLRGAKFSQGMIDSFRHHGMQAGAKNTFDCIQAFSERDFTEGLQKFDVPTLIVHSDDDQIIPIGASALHSAQLVKNAALKIYAGAPHGLAYTYQDPFDTDLMIFLRRSALRKGQNNQQ